MACDHCDQTTPVMFPMQPGHDGKPWELCWRCWLEGRQPFKLGRFKVTVIEDPHLADALTAASKRTAGLIDMGTTDEAPAKTRSRPRRS